MPGPSSGQDVAAVAAIQRMEGDSLRADTALLDQIRTLVAPSYEDPAAILARELASCDVAYLLVGPDRTLLSLFLVGFHGLSVNHEPAEALYMGLSATRPDLKNHGLVHGLYRQAQADARTREDQAGKRLIVWGTTVHPSPFRAVHNIWANVEPRSDGTFTDTGAERALALRQHLQVPPPTGHPFVLHGIAQGTRYSSAELARIDRVKLKHGFGLFESLGVDEAKGDRLLVVCEVPR